MRRFDLSNRGCRRAPWVVISFVLLISVLLCASSSWAQEAALDQRIDGEQIDSSPPIELGEEYSSFSRTKPTAHDNSSFFRFSLLYLPNRLFDLLDIVRADVGIGPSSGGILRVTKWGQAGMRSFYPGSLRVGLRGRRTPVFFEQTAEHGFGPWFSGSRQRKTTACEIGAGVDLFLAGAYLGVSLDSALDFILGFIGADIDNDDIR